MNVAQRRNKEGPTRVLHSILRPCRISDSILHRSSSEAERRMQCTAEKHFKLSVVCAMEGRPIGIQYFVEKRERRRQHTP